MTREEIAELVSALPQGLDADEFIYRLVNWAVDIEREACAKVVEAYTGAWNDEGYALAQAIRANRSQAATSAFISNRGEK
jgi:hypothetical protein